MHMNIHLVMHRVYYLFALWFSEVIIARKLTIGKFKNLVMASQKWSDKEIEDLTELFHNEPCL